MKEKNTNSSEVYKQIALIPYHDADELMKKLDIDLNFYKFAKYASLYDPKSYFIYGMLRIVKKSCISLMHKSDYVCERTIHDPGKNDIMDEADESMIDDENFLIRRLIEALVNAINFRSTNETALFMLFLNLENMEQFLREENELKRYYKIANRNIKSSIDDFVERIDDDIDKIKTSEMWFLDANNYRRRKFPLFKSVSKRFDRALSLSTPEEKVVLGMTYGRLFSSSSLSIHSSITSSPFDYSFKTAQNYFTVVNLISTQILNVTKELMGMPISEEDRQFTKDSKATIDKLIARQSKEFDTGDIVLAGGDLAEILERVDGEFGYTSYKIKYLGRPPIRSIEIEFWPSFYIVGLIKKNEPQEYVDKFKSNDNLKDGIALLKSQPDDKLFQALKKTLIEIDKNGLLNKVLYGNKS